MSLLTQFNNLKLTKKKKIEEKIKINSEFIYHNNNLINNNHNNNNNKGKKIKKLNLLGLKNLGLKNIKK